jgi:poly(3-hydroxybutyrate) depolymerase
MHIDRRFVLGLALITGVVAAAVSAPVAAKPRIEKRSFLFDGVERIGYVYVPASLPSEGAPLLLVFHGSGRDGRSVVDPWRKSADERSFVVVGLDSSNRESWRIPEDGPNTIKALVDNLAGEVAIDGKRIYLFGHSAGAVFVLRLALLESEYFAAAAVHAGTFREQSDYALIGAAERKIPVKILIGDRDEYFPLETAEATAAAFEAEDMPFDLEVVRGHGHWYYDKARSFNATLWEFLQQHALEAEPRWKDYRY